jgi:hypothetical protein
MAWMSSEAARIMGFGFLQTLTQADLIPEFQAPISRGWVVVDGATLLRAWYESYFGERSRFSEIIDYEVAVNGRGIPDIDLIEMGQARVSRLLRRGVAFAWAGLHEQHRQLSDARMAAYISAGPTLVDPEVFTGNVTFCAVRRGQPEYIDPSRLLDEIVIALFTEDCEKALPAV